MAIGVYMKIIQGKLPQHLSARFLSALSATWGGAFGWNRRAFSMQEATVPKYLATIFRCMDEHEQKLCNLMKQQLLVSTKLEHITRDKNDYCEGLKVMPGFSDFETDRMIVWVMELKSLSKEEGKLLNTLEIIAKDIKNLGATLSEERIKKVIRLLGDVQVAEYRHDCAVREFENMKWGIQYLDLIAYLFNNCEVIEDNCCTHKILDKMGRDLREKFSLLSEHLLADAINYFVERMQLIYRAELRCKFGLFLLASNVELNQLDIYSANLNWETFVAVTKFPEHVKGFQNQFCKLPTDDLCYVLQEYKKCMEVACGKDDVEWRSSFEEKLQKKLESDREQFMQVDNALYCQEELFQTWKEGYRIDFSGDPDEEVQKLKKRLEELKAAEEVQIMKKRLEELKVAANAN